MSHPYVQAIAGAGLVKRSGTICRVMPTFVEADGPMAELGTLCVIEDQSSATQPDAGVFAKVIGIQESRITLAPFDSHTAVNGTRISVCADTDTPVTGDALLGRAVDGLGRPIDGCGPLSRRRASAGSSAPVNPLKRSATLEPIHTGLRAIDGLFTIGKGQRLGIFAASGVGKTSLITQLTNQIAADRYVLCLVGERGREAAGLWKGDLAETVQAKTAMVVASASQSAAMRAEAADYALRIAEDWRDAGHHVLLVLDSMTRLAMALRELGLAAGEPPTLRAYTPGVFAALPKFVERLGATDTGAAITAILTVLCETDDADDPMAELLKSVLDGHILLSRTLAEAGHFPAIDPLRSLSRFANGLMNKTHKANAQSIIAQLSQYEGSRALIESGLHTKGVNLALDRAIERYPLILKYLAQDRSEVCDMSETQRQLAELANATGD